MRVLTFLRKRRAARQRALLEISGLPSLVVLLQVALAGGQSPRGALNAVRPFAEGDGPLAVATRVIVGVAERLSLGASFADAIIAGECAAEVTPQTQRVLDLLRRSELDGEPLMVHLDIVLLDLRRHRTNALDTAAQRLTVSLLFPLVFCILPAFIVLAVVPLVIGALAGLPT